VKNVALPIKRRSGRKNASIGANSIKVVTWKLPNTPFRWNEPLIIPVLPVILNLLLLLNIAGSCLRRDDPFDLMIIGIGHWFAFFNNICPYKLANKNSMGSHIHLLNYLVSR